MWELLTEVFKSGGFLALINITEAAVIVYLFNLLRQRNVDLLAMSEKRVKDVTQGKEDFQELSKNLDKSIDLLIKVFKQRNGD